jgi:hypothetical protein
VDVKVCGAGFSVRALAAKPKMMKRRKYVSQLFFIEILQIYRPTLRVCGEQNESDSTRLLGQPL